MIGGPAYAQMHAGLTHMCGVTASGAAFCWRLNDAGQLGDGTMTSRSSPVAVPNP